MERREGEGASGNMQKSCRGRRWRGIEIWGDRKQTRIFLYINECLEGVRRLMDSDFTGSVNMGPEKLISINVLAKMVMEIAGKKLIIRHVPGSQGVRGRKSDNTFN